MFNRLGISLIYILMALTFVTGSLSYIISRNIAVQETIKFRSVSEDSDAFFDYLHLSLSDRYNCWEAFKGRPNGEVNELIVDKNKIIKIKTSESYGNFKIKKIQVEGPPNTALADKYKVGGRLDSSTINGSVTEQFWRFPGKVIVTIQGLKIETEKQYIIPIVFFFNSNRDLNKCYAEYYPANGADEEMKDKNHIEDYCQMVGGELIENNQLGIPRELIETNICGKSNIPYAQEGSNNNTLCSTEVSNRKTLARTTRASMTSYCYYPQFLGCYIRYSNGKEEVYKYRVKFSKELIVNDANFCGEVAGIPNLDPYSLVATLGTRLLRKVFDIPVCKRSKFIFTAECLEPSGAGDLRLDSRRQISQMGGSISFDYCRCRAYKLRKCGDAFEPPCGPDANWNPFCDGRNVYEFSGETAIQRCGSNSLLDWIFKR